MAQINAVQLRTRDGRYLQARNGGGGTSRLVAKATAPLQWETFLFAPPMSWPAKGNDRWSLEVCDMNWAPAGWQIRVEESGRARNNLVSLFHGGPGADLHVTDCCVSRLGYAGRAGEWTFIAEKNGGGWIYSGDEVSIMTADGFYFRAEPGDGSLVYADSHNPYQGDTAFIAEFTEATPGAGLRPKGHCADMLGCIVDGNGQPFEDVRVSLPRIWPPGAVVNIYRTGTSFAPDGGPRVAHTDKQGRFALGCVRPVGQALLQFGHPQIAWPQTNHVVSVPPDGHTNVIEWRLPRRP